MDHDRGKRIRRRVRGEFMHRALAAIRRSSAGILLPSVAALTLVSGCISTTEAPEGPVLVPVTVDDDAASARSARIAWRPGAGAVTARGGGIEADYTRYRGSSFQTLQNLERVVVGGTIADGPQRLQHEVDLRYVHLAGTYTLTFDPDKLFKGVSARPFEMMMFAGLARLQFAIDSQGDAPGQPRLGRESDLRGMVLGLAPRLHIGEQVAIDARVAQAYLSEGGGYLGRSDVQQRSTELALAFRPIRHVELRGGYFWMHAEMPETFDDSTVSTSQRGLFLGLSLIF